MAIRDIFETTGATVPYRIEHLAVETLAHTDTYQRRVDRRHVARIAEHFDWAQLQPVTISQRADGSRFIIDGQHRIAALMQLGHGQTRIPCAVYTGLSVEAEGELFAGLNLGRKSLTPQERFRAALVAGEEEAHAIKATVERHGFRVNLDSGLRDHGGIPGIGALRHIVKNTTATTLDEVLGVAAAAWGTEEGPSATVLRGLSVFIRRYRGQYDRARLVERLRTVAPGRVESDGKDAKTILGLGSDEAVGYAIHKLYNHRLVSRRLAEWDMHPGRGRRG